MQTALLTLAIVGCGDDGRVSINETVDLPSGTRLVAGSSLERIGLLVIPREGGFAHLRDISSPAESLWAGRERLPAAVEAYSLGSTVVLREAGGTVHRYEPATDRVSVVGRVSPKAVWRGGGGLGVFADPADGAMLAISSDAYWSYSAQEAVDWALPAGEGVVLAIVGPPSGRRLLLFNPEADAPVVSDLDVGSLGLVTAWGSRLVVPQGGDDRLWVVSIPDLETVAEARLGGRPVALAASPSSHRVYVATADRPELTAIDRFSGSTRRIARFESDLTELRPSLLGEYLLAFDGEQAFRVSLPDGQVVPFDTSWRPDLPIGLPDERILVQQDGAILWIDPGDPDRGRRLATSGRAWWLPVHWRPGPSAPIRVAETDSMRGEDTARLVQGPVESPLDPVEQDDDPGDSPVPPGHYAIVSSSQQRSGVAELARALGRADFPTRIQRHRDEANEVWYRALVGPYPRREQAEAIAGRLRSERGLQVWISEIGPDPGGTTTMEIG